MRIVELTGLSYPAVRSTIDRFDAGGLAALKPTANHLSLLALRVLRYGLAPQSLFATG